MNCVPVNGSMHFEDTECASARTEVRSSQESEAGAAKLTEGRRSDTIQADESGLPC